MCAITITYLARACVHERLCARVCLHNVGILCMHHMYIINIISQFFRIKFIIYFIVLCCDSAVILIGLLDE